MTDIVERCRKNQCPENTGCNTNPFCSCADLEEAADYIIELEAKLAAAESQPAVPDAHQLWAAAQLGHGEGITDGIARIEALLAAGDSHD